MKRTIALAVLGGAALAALGHGAAVDRTALAQKQSALATEYGLAKESNFYFVLDVPGRKLELRVRGMVLKSWPLQAMRFWGSPGFAGTVELVRKTALKAPERIVIKPGDAAEAEATPAATGAAAPASPAEFDLEALELKDMPKRFSLDFDNGLRISITAGDGASRGLAGRLKDAWHWYVDLPLRNLFDSRGGKSISELELTFEQGQDAQAIYWHFFEGIQGIVF
jgi:hypothetical protein